MTTKVRGRSPGLGSMVTQVGGAASLQSCDHEKSCCHRTTEEEDGCLMEDMQSSGFTPKLRAGVNIDTTVKMLPLINNLGYLSLGTEETPAAAVDYLSGT